MDSKTGKPKVYAKYGDAKPDLLRQLGGYCSYCEMELKDGHEVEHVQPKSRRKALALEWSNFLLACKRCNTRKGSKQVKLDDHVWPDLDNTARAFEYTLHNQVVVSTSLKGANRDRAQNLLELVGLDQLPTTRFEDPRFDHRLNAWAKALDARNDVWKARPEDKSATRKRTATVATLAGHFSVWMTVFADDPEMRQLLIEAFTGTSQGCFDTSTTDVVRRPGGKL